MDDVLVHTPKEILDTEKGLPFVKGATAAHTRTQSQTPLFSPLKREIHQQLQSDVEKTHE